VVWATDVAGVLAVGGALATNLPVTRRVITIAGPAAAEPRHLDLCLGHPIDELAPAGPGRRVLRGGVMTGDRISAPAGVTITTSGLTVLPDIPRRRLLGFARPGWSSRSYSRWYLSALRGWFPQRLTTALRGERRACVACGHCRKVCPAGLWPQWIHKALYAEDLDEAESLGVDLCIGCGLCSFVCPSKIELADALADARQALAVDRELQGAMR
jgi:Na+-transporting NADH:ubiquinone oxidoreductase subunit A